LPAAERRELIEVAAAKLFGARGYHGVGVAEIARRAGVTVPVLYDHFPSKAALYSRLLERHFEELRAIWFRHARTDSVSSWIGTAIDAWFAYVETHPFATRMFLRDTGDTEIVALQARIERASRAQLLPLVAEPLASSPLALEVELAWESLRGVMQSLAAWWAGHRDVPRDTIAAAAMNAIWLGFERALAGERWSPSASGGGRVSRRRR
jgi:AcrR family transcriptional regulator